MSNGSPFLTPKQLEAKLAKLERSYESDTAFLRKANADLKDVTALEQSGAIDREHALILREAITDKGREAHTRLKAKHKVEKQAKFEKEARSPVAVVLIIIAILWYLLLSKCLG